MERLERDLRYFKQELEKERNQYRRNLLLSQIRDVEQKILDTLREERERMEIQNRNMQIALDKLKQMKKK